MNTPRFKYTSDTGEHTSVVPGWDVTYPARCNGHLGDIAYVSSRGLGGSDFVHFDLRTGEPYGFPLTKAVRKRLLAMRAAFGKEVGA